MNASREKIYNYSHLFAVTLVFSALATEIFIFYSFLRRSFWTPFEPMIVALMLCSLFSLLGQRLSKVNQIRRWIFLVSVFSSALIYEFFLAPTTMANIGGKILDYGIVSGFMWIVYWEFLDYSWKYLSRIKITKKPVAIIFGSSILVILAIFFASVYSEIIMSFFDTHPWAMTLIGVLITLLGGIFIGRRTK